MPAESAREIRPRFTANIGRVRSLLRPPLQNPSGAFGHPPALPSDVRDEMFRAGVVLLHATLEDLLRSIEMLRLPLAKAEELKSVFFVPFGGSARDRRERLTLQDLADWRGRSVDEVIGAAVEAYVEHSNYNNVPEIVGALRRTGLDGCWDARDGGQFEAVMSRRHLIAHRADRGRRGLEPITHDAVAAWMSVVEALGERVLTELEGAKS